jgi:hypothetical protein
VPFIGAQFATPNVPISGSNFTPNVGSNVSMRLIASPGNWDATRHVIPLGESGDPKVVDLMALDGQDEQVEYDENGDRIDREDTPADDDEAKSERAERERDGDNTGADRLPEGDSSELDSFNPEVEAEGDAEVVAGGEPPVDQSTERVKEWVGSDPNKAQRALEAERAARNRAGLVSWLEKVVATGPDQVHLS